MEFEGRKYVVSRLEYYESNFPVEDWLVEGVHVWPIVKFYFTHKLYKTSISKGNKINHKVSPKTINKNPHSISHFIKAIKGFFSFYFKIFPKVNLIAGSLGDYSSNWNNTILHKYYDPIIDELEQSNKKGLIISLNKNTITTYKSNRIKDISDWSYYIRLIKRKTKHHLMKQAEYVRFIDELSTELNTINIKLEETLNQIYREVLIWKLVYKQLFKKTKPEISFCLCYYSSEFYGMCAAAYEMNIISVDLQHGGQGMYHTAYKFLRLPKLGYTVLPKVFWTWDELSTQFIQSWTKNSWHKVVNGGNCWVNFINSQYTTVKSIENEKKIILVTLQNSLKPIIDDCLVDAIKKTDETRFVWWLRYHPRMTQLEKNDVSNSIVSNNLEKKVNVEYASSIPLPVALLKCSVHLSKYSGSILEAALMNKINIIIDELGKEAFYSLIEEEKALFFNVSNNNDLYGFIIDEIEKDRYKADNQVLNKSILDLLNEISRLQ